MVRYVSAIILLCAFALQSFNGALILVSYYSNTAAYSKDCVNKFRPQLHCEGKCVMMKKIIEAEKKDQQTPVPNLEIKNDVFTAGNLFIPIARLSLTRKTNYTLSLPGEALTGFLQGIFHPPANC